MIGVNPVGKEKVMTDIDFKKEFRIFQAKGPVVYDGVQRRFWQACRNIQHLLTDEEYTKLFVARCHAINVGEGREEWDSICKEVEKRLFSV